ncbi:MAG TPA: hypothetical protein VG253_02665 [Streptosporangiaceae bacterium]|jgi:hypothetical protein|nr:hypothetical protein [Streptosporangiaceae bacterium]
MDRSSEPDTQEVDAAALRDAAILLLTPGLSASSGQVPTTNDGVRSADVIRYPADDHRRLLRVLSDVVVHRLFAAGLDLQAALALIGEDRGAGRIHDAIGELDQAIRDLRHTVFCPSGGGTS